MAFSGNHETAMTQNTIHLPAAPVRGECDALVCGGGPAGCAAALAARREGLDVLLVEAQGQLGGTGTSGLVTHWLGGRMDGGREWAVGGLFRSLAEEAAALGIARLPLGTDYQTKYQPHGWFRGLLEGVPFDPCGMAAFLDRKMEEAGVRVLLDTQAAQPVVHDGRISHVVLANKDGLTAVSTRAVIDATGDADLAARSGCRVVCGREGDGLMAPASLEFLMDGVDMEALSAYIHEHDTPRFREEIRKLREAGEWPFPYDIMIAVETDRPGTVMVNTTRLVGVDGTSAASMSDGLRRGRREVLDLADVLRRRFPGFADARVKAVAPMLGVRETRRIMGRVVMGVSDVLDRRAFPDVIGFSAYGWDLPDPRKPSCQPMHERKVAAPRMIPIPFAIMVPEPVENLLCPGRAVSVERDVLGPLRVMAPCMAMGEACGAAAAQIAAGTPNFNVDAERLRARLHDCGCVVDAQPLRSGDRLPSG